MSLLSNLPSEELSDLYEHAPCGYISTAEDGTIVRANGTFLRLTGYTRDEVVGHKRLQDLLTPGSRIYHETHYAPMLRMQGFVREIAVEFERADGARLPALVNSIRLERDGQPIIRTVVLDATERRRYEEELLEERTRARESEAQARVLAQTLQESLIPPEPSQIPGLEIAAIYRPSGAGDVVGGDFYDVFETRRGDWIVAIGDVSGKGAEAARVTAAARYTIRAAATASSRPRVLLTALNEALLAQRTLRYCTVACMRIVRRDSSVRVTFGSAGHPLPIGVHGGALTTFGEPGMLLGAFEDAPITETMVELARGDVVVLYTDGVTEGRAPDGDFFGEERLAQIIDRHRAVDATELASIIASDVMTFQGGTGRDDIAIVVLRRPL